MENLVNTEFWRGKKVLLTGHTGFKGSWLTIWLHQLGAKVIGVSLPPEKDSLFEQAQVAGLAENFFIDIRNWDTLSALISEQQPEIVIHMAAQPLVGLSYDEPVATYATNVMGTIHVLEACRKTSSIKSAVIITTDKCYRDNRQGIPHIETDPLGGHDPYSNSKACAEMVTQSYVDSFFAGNNRILCATARAGNVIGGGDWAEQRLIPDTIRAWMAGHDIELRNPAGVRPWQHVLEPLAGYLILAKRLFEGDRTACGAWNFSPAEGNHRNVGWIVEQLKARLPKATFGIITPDKSTYHETQMLRLDSNKARQLGWSPRYDIGRTLDEVCKWYAAHRERSNMLTLCRDQIRDYISG